MGEVANHQADSMSAADRVPRLLPAVASVGDPILTEIVPAAIGAVGAIGALQKIARRTLADGSPVHSFRTLLHELSTIVRNTCCPATPQHIASTFQMTTMPNPTQQRALQLLQSITV